MMLSSIIQGLISLLQKYYSGTDLRFFTIRFIWPTSRSHLISYTKQGIQNESHVPWTRLPIEFYFFAVIWIWYQSTIWRIFRMMKIQKFWKRWNHQNRSDIFTDLDKQTILFENFFATANDSVTFKISSETENQYLWILLLIQYTKILLINNIIINKRMDVQMDVNYIM